MLYNLGVALCLGLVVGLQRQRTDARVAGFRTFPLVTLFGTICATVAKALGGVVVAAGAVGLAALIVIANVRDQASKDPGMTTEVALLLMYAVGAYLVIGSLGIAVALGGSVAVLLHMKPHMHALAAKIGDRDFRAIMQFVVVSMIVLPLVPDRAYGPYRAINPQHIWLMVVFIVGLSLGAYLIYKFIGQKAGTLAAGLLGGLISSTATTIAIARRSRQTPGSNLLPALAILLASAMVYLRIIIILGIAAPRLLRTAAAPMVAMLGLVGALSFGLWWRSRNERTHLLHHANPTELKAALLFALIYTVVSLAVAAAKHWFGQAGLYAVAVVSGLDMDAITLSLGQMTRANQLDANLAWRLLLLASLASLLFKAGLVASLGNRRLLIAVGLWFVPIVAGGAAVFVWWP